MVPYAFVWEKGKTMDFSETIVIYDLKLATDDRSDKKFLLTSKLCPLGAVCPLPWGYIHVLNQAIIFLFSDLQTRRLYYLRKANKNKTPTLLFYYFSPRRFHVFSCQRNKSIRLYTVKKCVRLYCVTRNENQSLTDDKKLKVEQDTNC